MSIKLIAIDIDGTLINSSYEITPYTKEVIHQARKEGVKVVLCTGRPFLGAQPYVNELGLDQEDDFLITYNGALIQKIQTKETIHHIGLTGKDYKKLAKIASDIGTYVHAMDFHAIYTPHRDISHYTGKASYFSAMPIKFRTVEEVNENDRFTKMIFIDEADRLDAALEKIPPELKEQYTMFKSEPIYCEILNKKASKGAALRKLASILNVSQHEIMAIGDHPNDYDMIEYAGIGIAMGNAVDEIKHVADYITLTNDEDGVAKAIEKFVLQKNIAIV